MAATLVVYAAARVAVATWWRPSFRAPIELLVRSDDQRIAPEGSWLLGTFVVDREGHRLSNDEEAELFNAWTGAQDVPIDELLRQRGLSELVVYHPADRLIPFELLEAGIFVALAVALLGLTIWWVRRRIP
jgi:hypothetical protein